MFTKWVIKYYNNIYGNIGNKRLPRNYAIRKGIVVNLDKL
jgi:hypothetical protein